jgi:hypothetical protein
MCNISKPIDKDDTNTNPQIIIETDIEGTTNGNHSADTNMSFLGLIGILFIPILIFSPILGKELNNEFKNITENIDKGQYDSNQIKLMAARYYMIAKYPPSFISIPSTRIIIYGDKSYSYTNDSSNIIVRYDYGDNKYDQFNYNIRQKIKVTYTNDLLDVNSLIPPKYIPIFIGSSIIYTIKTKTMGYPLTLGYGIRIYNQLYFVPGLQINISEPALDIYAGIHYNIYGINIGIGYSFVEPAIGLSIGFYPSNIK